MSKQVTQFHTKPEQERNIHNKRELGLPGKEYQKMLREAKTKREAQSYLIDKATKKIDELAELYVPRLYSILVVKEGRKPVHARKIVLNDLVHLPETPVWKKETVLKWIPREAKDQDKALAGIRSSEVRRAKRELEDQEQVNEIVEQVKSASDEDKKSLRKTLAGIVGKPTRDTMLVDVHISKEQHEKFVQVFAASNGRGYTIHLRNTEVIGLDPISW